MLSRYRNIPEPLELLCDNFMKSLSEEFFPIWVTLKFWHIISCRLESLFRYVHNGTPVLSHAESKMKKELEDIKTFLQFHRESLEQVQCHSDKFNVWFVWFFFSKERESSMSATLERVLFVWTLHTFTACVTMCIICFQDALLYNLWITWLARSYPLITDWFFFIAD